jgi:hypothetical protein
LVSTHWTDTPFCRLTSSSYGVFAFEGNVISGIT